MGDPGKIRRKYDTPSHPWQRARIEEEKPFIVTYGLVNKQEIWRMKTFLGGFKDQAKALASRTDAQSRKEEEQLLNRMISLNLLKHGEGLDKILGLELKDVMERRLQTILVKKGLARTLKQARQFITHNHILVDGKKITFPSYIVSLKEESLIGFVPKSSLAKDDHPERIIKETAKSKADKKKKSDKEEIAPPTFAEEEIVQLEVKGAVEKPVEDNVSIAPSEHKPAVIKSDDKKKENKPQKKKEAKKE
jgi:small subunit ribosomal protein S4